MLGPGAEDALSFAAFVTLILFAVSFRVSSRVLIAAGLVVLIIAATTTLLGYGQTGNYVAIAAYFLLVVGVIEALAEYYRDRRARGGKAKELREHVENALTWIRSCLNRTRALPPSFKGRD